VGNVFDERLSKAKSAYTFLNPESDPLVLATHHYSVANRYWLWWIKWQRLASRNAIATRSFYLKRHTDFIFSPGPPVFSEEFGFWGIVGLLAYLCFYRYAGMINAR